MNHLKPLFFALLAGVCLSRCSSSSDDSHIIAPGRGAELWHSLNQSIDIPVEGEGFKSLDMYYRFQWHKVEKTQNVYDFSFLDSLINEAIDNKQKFSFGIMTACPGCEDQLSYDGANSSYPSYLHSLMQGESSKDWIGENNTWVPNWNSTNYLSRFEALLTAINTHIQNTSYKGVSYKNVMGYIDIRGYGAWGEWHMSSLINNIANSPSGTAASAVTLKKIIDIHVSSFPDIQLVAMIGAYEAGSTSFPIFRIPPAVSYHALTVKNNRGLLGIRRDQWGATDEYLSKMLENNNATYNGVVLKNLIMDRWKYAPFNGEPPGYPVVVDGCDLGDLPRQVEFYHASSFGNGNFGSREDCTKQKVREASKLAGYRLVIQDAKVTLGKFRALSVKLSWQNVGIAPTYEDWDVYFDLRDDSDHSVWKDKSSMKLRLFLPSNTDKVVSDNFTLPNSVPKGTYSLHLMIKDPNGYRDPLPLAITDVGSDGSYLLDEVVLH